MSALPLLATLVVTNVASFNAALSRPAVDASPIHLEGRATYVRHSDVVGIIGLRDDSGFTMITYPGEMNEAARDILPGNRLAMDVHIMRNLTTRIYADAFKIAKLDSCRSNEVCDISAKDFYSGQFDYRHVRIGGILRDIVRSETSDAWALMTIIADHDVVLASMPIGTDEMNRLRKLIGSRITEEGIVTPGIRANRPHAGTVLHCDGERTTTVIGSGTLNAFACPDIRELSEIHPRNMTTLGRFRTEGRILAIASSGEILLRSRSNDIVAVTLLDQSPPPCGTVVEVAGFPRSDLFNINLEQAIWRPTQMPVDDPKPPAATTLDAIYTTDANNKFLNYTLHGQLAKLTGTVKNIPPPGHGESIVYIESQGQLISVDAVSNSNANAWFTLGSEVEITGILSMRSDNWSSHRLLPQITGYSVILRSGEDVRVVRAPPFWTAPRLYAVLALLLLVIVMLFLGRRADKAKAALRIFERTRLAEELHDSLAQNLTGVSMELEAGHIPIASKMLDSCRKELRNCLWDLRSRALDNKTMNETIRTTLLPQLGERPANIRFNVDKKLLSQQLIHALMRIIRELVINAIRHGKANRLRIAGTLCDGRLLCSVTDNGIGFDPDVAPGTTQGHFGLEGIRERLAAFNGTLTLTSVPGRGTRAAINIPLIHGR